MAGIIQSIPDLSTLVLSLASNPEGQVTALLQKVESLVAGDESSPVGEVFTAIAGLDSRLNIDWSGLSEQLPNTLAAIRNALPANTLSHVTSLGASYETARDFLENSALVKEVTSSGVSLREVALAVIADILTLFDGRLSDLTSNVVDPDILNALRAALSSLEDFETDFPAHSADFLPFVTSSLMGVAPDLLDAPLAHLNTSLSVFAPLERASLEANILPNQQAVISAHQDLVALIQSFDPADVNAYVQITARLDALESANDVMLTALGTLYQQLDTLISNHAWNDIFGLYADLLDTIAIDDIVSVDDIVDRMVEMLEDVLARMFMVFDVQDMEERIQLLGRSIRDAALGSPMGQIQSSVRGFLEDIRDEILAIPTEEIQALVLGLLTNITDQVNELGIGDIQDAVTDAFNEADTFITENINTALGDSIRTQLETFAADFQPAAVTDLMDELTAAISQLSSIMDNVETTLNSELSNLEDIADQLNDLSFEPISNEAISRIDEIKGRLATINPDALSDAEKLALKGALAVIEAIDLDGLINDQLKAGYHAAEREVITLLEQIEASLGRVRDRFLVFSPDGLLGPVNNALDQVESAIEDINGQLLLKALYDQLDALKSRLGEISPGGLLNPLQPAYDAFRSTLDQVSSDRLVQPLHAIYDRIDSLIDIVDITPLLNELDTRQKALFNDARTRIIDGLTSLDLPEPLNGFFGRIQPLLELMTDALFADPDTGLRQLDVEFRNRVNLGDLFAPLDDLFMRLIHLMQSIPPEDLTETMNAIRVSLGVGMHGLNPHNILGVLRGGYGRLADISPTLLLGVSFSLPAVKLAFEARAASAPGDLIDDREAVSARFDVVLSGVGPTVGGARMQQLMQQHGRALEALRTHINALDVSSVGENYARVRRNLDRLVPDFLQQSTPLTHADIIAGIYAMRPSERAQKFETVLSRLLRELDPLETSLESAINDMLLAVRETLMMVNPLSLNDSVTAIYDAIREKVRVIDPDDLKEAIDAVFAPLESLVDTVNPSNIKNLIDASFNKMVNGLTTNVRDVLDQLVGIINEQLRAIKDTLKSLMDAVRTALQDVTIGLEGILVQFDNLIFVEIFDRLRQVMENLGRSFDKELERVGNAFNQMLGAIPLDGGAGAGVSL
jgi:hypothetical protein